MLPSVATSSANSEALLTPFLVLVKVNETTFRLVDNIKQATQD